MKKSQFTVRRYDVSPSYYAETREHFNQLTYYPSVTYKNVSRYSNLRTLKDDDGNTYHESWNQKYIDYTDSDQYFTVTSVEEDRLDIISVKFYGTPRYWWVIAIANYILDPFNVPTGTNLRIPPMLSLYNKGGVLGG